MGRYIDLSWPLENDMPVYPGDPRFSLEPLAAVRDDGYCLTSLECGLHVGTHVDMPSHFLDDGKTVADYPLDGFCGDAVVLDAGQGGLAGDCGSFAGLIEDGDIVLLHTGFGRYYGTERYYRDHPQLDRDFVDLLVKKRVPLLGLDTPSPDRAPYEIHRLILQRGIFIVENLANLWLIAGSRVSFFAFPLKIRAEASPVRAAALTASNRHAIMQANKAELELRE